MNEPLEPMDVERVFGEIAGVTPTPESTRRALARAGAALAAAPRRRMRWVLPASIAAAVIVAAGIGLSLLPSRASAQEALATTLRANEEYKGWVHLSYGKDMTRSEHWNTQTHADASYIEGMFMADPSKAGEIPETRITFRNPDTGETSDYFSATGLVRIGTYLPEMSYEDPGLETPLQFPSLIEQLRAVMGQDAVKIVQSSDRGLDRFDITIATPATQRVVDFQNKGAGSLGRPSAVWVDPKTKLIRAALVDGQEMTLTYGAPEMRSIFDVGVPKVAKICDNRPTPETVATFKRVLVRAQKPFPDGVAVLLTVGSAPSSFMTLEVYGKSGEQWAMRNYPVASVGGLAPTGRQGAARGLQVPEHWQDSGAGEFFQRLAAAMPTDETGGDGTKAWRFAIDQDTGEQVVTYYSETVDEKGGIVSSTEGKIAGREEYTGEAAKMMARTISPARWCFPTRTIAGFASNCRVDLITSPDRPGETAFRVLVQGSTPDTLRAIFQEWIDPAHENRAVSFQELFFRDAKVRQIEDRHVKQFGQYATLPAPDGRSYPTSWTETTYDGDGNVQYGPNVSELRFFPGRRMPEIPKKPPRP
jgi:hypothetical protein